MSQEDLLSVEDLTQILDVSPDTIRSWIEQGLLKPVPSSDVVKFRFEDVQALAGKRFASQEYGFRILIIEDDPLVGQSLKVLLQKSGFEATTVPIGLAALDSVVRETFDLILADVRMPGMNGIETLKAIRELRSQFELPRLPEIIITAYEDEEIRQEAARMGISDFILKPFDLKELISVIERNLKHAA